MSASNALAMGPVSLRWCKILDLNVDATNVPLEGERIDISMDTNFRRVDEDGFPSGLEVAVSIRPSGGRYYSLSMSARALFDFPEGISSADAENYLAEVAPSRMLDVLRVYVAQITEMCAFGSMEVPPLTPVVNAGDWRRDRASD